MFSQTRTLEIYEIYKKSGSYDQAGRELGISKESVRRAVRMVNNKDKKKEQFDSSLDSTVSKLIERYTPEELKLIANGFQLQTETYKPIHNFNGQPVKIGVLTDLHIGSKYTESERIYEAFEEFNRNEVDMVMICGDVTEGLSNRPGHIYECSQIGYEAQKDKAIEILGQWDNSPMYMIDGNHDRWYIKSAGACIVKDICENIENAEFIGHDVGEIQISPSVKIMLWHGEDGSSYSLSYRLQKIIESLSGGTKPNVMFCGHTHKYCNIFERNIYTVSCGSIQRQTPWMRGKRLSAHVGFSIFEMEIHDTGIGRFKHEWFPFYV